MPQKNKYRLRMINPVYPAFNIYSHIAQKTTALGPLCVASNARNVPDWEVEVIDENNLRRFGPKDSEGGADHAFLEESRPSDLIGLYGGLTSTIPRLLRIARFYKYKGKTTIAGGQHFVEETVDEALRSGIDYIVLGEGELTIVELLKVFEGKIHPREVKGIAYLENGKLIVTEPRAPIADLDSMPFPDFSLLRYAKVDLYPVGRIRGCGMDCEFCTVKGKPRCASNSHMAETVFRLVEIYGAKDFFIVDDLFGQQRDETIALCHKLRDYQKQIGKKLEFTVQIRLDKAKDSELLSAMRAAGITMVCIGFESPIEEELKSMNKCIRAREMIELSKIYHRQGFFVHGMFIFGYPLKEGTFLMPSEERIKRFKHFIKKARIDTVQVLLPGPLPGTELRERLKAQGRIFPLKEIGWEYYDGNFPLFVPDLPLSPEELQNCAQKIMGKFYQFRSMLLVGFQIISFPGILLSLNNFKLGWQKWYHLWRNSLLRFAGWIIISKWSTELKKGTFFKKLHNAKNFIKLLQSEKQ